MPSSSCPSKNVHRSANFLSFFRSGLFILKPNRYSFFVLVFHRIYSYRNEYRLWLAKHDYGNIRRYTLSLIFEHRDSVRIQVLRGNRFYVAKSLL